MLSDWVNEDVDKSLAKALEWYVKQEDERKTRFFVENDLEKTLEQSQWRYFVSLLYKTKRFQNFFSGFLFATA